MAFLLSCSSARLVALRAGAAASQRRAACGHAQLAVWAKVCGHFAPQERRAAGCARRSKGAPPAAALRGSVAGRAFRSTPPVVRAAASARRSLLRSAGVPRGDSTTPLRPTTGDSTTPRPGSCASGLRPTGVPPCSGCCGSPDRRRSTLEDYEIDCTLTDVEEIFGEGMLISIAIMACWGSCASLSPEYLYSRENGMSELHRGRNAVLDWWAIFLSSDICADTVLAHCPSPSLGSST